MEGVELFGVGFGVVFWQDGGDGEGKITDALISEKLLLLIWDWNEQSQRICSQFLKHKRFGVGDAFIQIGFLTT